MEFILSWLHQGLSALLPFVILLGLLIFVHELGHFLVAKYFGVRVEVFSLGFGKKIFQYKRGDTNYCLSLIPLGGYVKMFGDDPSAEISEEQKQFSFNHKPVGQRIGVVLAGPLMNFFFAILLFFIVALVGEEVRSPVLGDIETNTAAYKSGFRSGDTILSVDGKPVIQWNDIGEDIEDKSQKPVRFEVKHEVTGTVDNVEAVPELKPNNNVLSTKRMVGDIEGLNFLSRASTVGISQMDSLAALAGLKTGDRIAEINGTKIDTWRELDRFLQNNKEATLNLSIERYSENMDEPQKITAQINLDLNKNQIDQLGFEKSDLYLAKVVEKSPAAQAGLKAGDRILNINDQPAHTWEDVLKIVTSYKPNDPPVKFEVFRDGKSQIVQITPEMTAHMTTKGSEENRFTIGVIPYIMSSRPLTFKYATSSPVEALKRGVHKSWDVTVMTVMSFLRLLQAEISPKNIGGVISIGQAASETFKIGISHFLQMMAMISINLFILNLLPIPVLDGGHLVFFMVEALRGAPLSLRKMEIAQQVGLVLLVSLMVFALFNDFTRIFSAW